jgi:hypothetical protein
MQRPSPPPSISVELLPDLLRTEAVLIGGHLLKPWLQYRPSLLTDEDSTLSSVVLGFVRFRDVLPHVTCSIDVARSHQDNLAGSAAGKPLKADHRLQLRREKE